MTSLPTPYFLDHLGPKQDNCESSAALSINYNSLIDNPLNQITEAESKEEEDTYRGSPRKVKFNAPVMTNEDETPRFNVVQAINKTKTNVKTKAQLEHNIITKVYYNSEVGHKRRQGIELRKEMGPYDYGKPPFPIEAEVVFKKLEIN